MDAHGIWLIVLAVSPLVAGVIGFAIQLRTTKKLRLENEKLQLEIAALRDASAKRESRIVIPTNDEVLRIARPKKPSFDAGRHPNFRFGANLAIAVLLLLVLARDEAVARFLSWVASWFR